MSGSEKPPALPVSAEGVPERVGGTVRGVAKTQGLSKQQKAAYDDVVECAQLTAIFMIKSSFDVEPAYFEAFRNGALAGDHFEYGSEIGHCEFQNDKDTIIVPITWGVNVNGPGDSSILKISATFYVIYSGIAGHDVALVRRFGRDVGSFSSYPYFRSFVSQLSWLSNAQLPILPVLKGPRRHSKAKPPASEPAPDATSA